MKRTAPQTGFTLIELMMVVLIIAIGAATVRLIVPQSDPLNQAEKIAQQFQHWFTQQQDQSLMSHEDLGLYFLQSEIISLNWRQGDRVAGEAAIVWEVVDQLSYGHDIESLDFELLLDIESNNWQSLRNAVSDHETITPHVILFASEEYQPSFLFRISQQSYTDEFIELTADGYNRMELNRVSR